MSSINQFKNSPEGDISSFEEVYHMFSKRVYAFSLKYLRNKEDAEGVVQEVFIKLWVVRSRLTEIENLEAWIFTVCFNIIRKHFKRMASEKKHILNFTGMHLSDDNSSMTEIEYNDLIQKVEFIIDKLPARQKAVYLLSKNKGLSNSEIALKLKITKKTVENHLFKAKVTIRNTMVREGLI
jgi:RNA polymerase sigma-70 factor (family 1)